MGVSLRQPHHIHKYNGHEINHCQIDENRGDCEGVCVPVCVTHPIEVLKEDSTGDE
jgi:hypothetical protein